MTDTVPRVTTLPTQRRPGPFDPPAELAALRDRHPLVRMTYPDGHDGWLATGHQVVRTVLADRRFMAFRALLARSPGLRLDCAPEDVPTRPAATTRASCSSTGDGRARRGREGASPRALRELRGDDPARRRRTPDRGRADGVAGVQPRHRAGGPAGVPRTRHRRGALQPARTRHAHRRPAHRTRRRRLPPHPAAVPAGEPRAQPRDGRGRPGDRGGARRHSGQVALAWLLAQGEDVVPIPGTKRVPYLEENAGALDVALTAADHARLDALRPAGERYPDMTWVERDTRAGGARAE